MNTQTKGNGAYSPIRFMLFYIAVYAGNSVYQNFQTAYYQKIGGLDTTQIGMIMTIPPFIALLAQPLWGYSADNMRTKNMTLRILALGTSISALIFPLSSTMMWLAVVTGLFAVFQTSILVMGDAITLENLTKQRMPFGPVRLSGTLSFALMSAIIGAVLTPHPDWMPYFAAGLYFVTFLATFALPKTPGHGREKASGKAPVSVLFKNKQLMLLLLALTLLQVTLGFFYSFFSVHVLTNLNGNEAWLGRAYMLSALSEVPFLIFSDRLYRKFGAGKLMLIAALLMSVRWVLIFSIHSLTPLLFTQLLHGGGFIVISFSMSRYMNDSVPDELKATGQTLIGIVALGLSRIIGSFFGGMLSNRFGIDIMFLGCAGVTGLTAIMLAVMHAKGLLKPRPVSNEITGNKAQ